MAFYECIVQEGSTASELEAELAQDLIRVRADVLGASGGANTVDFVVVPRGSGFTAAEVSTTSIVNVELPDDCPYEVRKNLMEQVCASWYRITGCRPDELVVFTTDRSLRN